MGKELSRLGAMVLECSEIGMFGKTLGKQEILK
jgi:hypothetical protein